MRMPFDHKSVENVGIIFERHYFRLTIQLRMEKSKLILTEKREWDIKFYRRTSVPKT